MYNKKGLMYNKKLKKYKNKRITKINNNNINKNMKCLNVAVLIFFRILSDTYHVCLIFLRGTKSGILKMQIKTKKKERKKYEK